MRYDIKVVNSNGHKKYLMHKDDVWKFNKIDENHNRDLRKNYIIEYVNNPKIWDAIVAEKYLDPIEHYTVVEFETLWDAMEFYLFRLFDTKTFDVKMLCQTILDDEVVLEECMEFCPTFHHEFRKLVNKESVTMRDSALNAIKELKKENERMMAFIKKYNAEKVYKEFIEEESK